MDTPQENYQKFLHLRQANLWNKLPGIYRAVITDTNDPLNMGRVRIKVPELHDFDLATEECPWAVPNQALGGKSTVVQYTPTIGDWVWVTFEKQHAYAPVWIGFATPLKNEYYAPFLLSQKPDYTDTTYNEEYFPKDGRPMVAGYQDRYGNIDISSSVGFYPIEHDLDPPAPDIDPYNKNILGNILIKPEVNNPDKKYITQVTKYGNILQLSDQGYYWKKEAEYGEFTGNFEQDKDYELKRTNYLLRLLNEDKPDTKQADGDQRRISLATRYGHKIECRDVGWAQPGPTASKSRPTEYGTEAYLSKEANNDYRWIKIRTKGGMLFQAYDKGFHPQNDTYIQRSHLDEVGPLTEREDIHWAGKDARWIRLVTRHGYKIVLDDRGSDNSRSEELENPTGNGVLLKGRRSPSAHGQETNGNPRGFYFEFNENIELNHTNWGTPAGQLIEQNDRYQYIMLSSGLGDDYAAEYKGIEENEFIGKPALTADPETNSHHLKIDLDNEYIRFKTRSKNGPGPKDPLVTSGVEIGDVNQGFEARDGQEGDGPWVEIVDSQNRGFWFSRSYQCGIWRSSSNNNMSICLDDTNKKIILQNNEQTGALEIYCTGQVNIISDDNINLQAVGSINMKASSVNIDSGGLQATFGANFQTTGQILASNFQISPGGSSVGSIQKSQLPSRIFPSDRAKTYNGPYPVPPREIIEHPL